MGVEKVTRLHLHQVTPVKEDEYVQMYVGVVFLPEIGLSVLNSLMHDVKGENDEHPEFYL
jgi:hypothetical protein